MHNSETIIHGLDQEKLLRTFGARHRQSRISSGLKRRLSYWQTKLHRLLTPRISHRIIPMDHGEDHIQLLDGTCFRSPKLAETLVDATEICCFVATVGPGVEVAVKECMADNRYTDAFILDTLGSMAAESLVDRFHKGYEKQCLSRGQSVTLRFSPGYCDWAITDQIHLFSVFEDEHPADVQLTETCLMSPCKSVSGVFGILPISPDGSGGILEKHNPCKSCRQPRCRARRI